jgi:tetraacyldisaccharide 4'-kinase
VRTIGIGGATLGGSCKTPLAIALARALADRGERVAIVGHAYRARPRSARRVAASDALDEVGDEALLAAQSLADRDVAVVVGPTRQAAVDFGARHASWLVIDGLLQSRPRPLTRSVLVLDEHRPWGNQRFPPAGDLRAPREALLDVADRVMIVRDADQATSPTDVVARLDHAVARDGLEIRLADLRGVSFGLILAIARPERILQALVRRGLQPAARIELADHACPTANALERAASRKQRVKAWLTTAKCAVKLPAVVANAPVLALAHELELPKGWVDWVLSEGSWPDAFCPSSPAQNPW